MTVLYICYQSILEPLTENQVVAYLEGLARTSHRVALLTFEPQALALADETVLRERLASRGIHWEWLHYHKSPTVPAKLWDLLIGVTAGLALIRRHRVRLLHARCHIAGLMALALRRLTGARVLFDIRGFMAEEYVDGGNWSPGGMLFRTTKRVERFLVRAADGLVVLSEAARDQLREWYPVESAGKPLEVIPCCVDFRRLEPAVPTQRTAATSSGATTIVYAGKLGGWYPTAALVEFLAVAAETLPRVRCTIWTQSDSTDLQRLLTARGLEHCARVGYLTPDRLATELSQADIGLCLDKRKLSRAGISPTKVGEYLAAGLPVVCSAGMGDTDRLLSGNGQPDHQRVGALVENFHEREYRKALCQLAPLLADPTTSTRCRAVARQFLDLEAVGWVRYRRLYQQLLHV